jgi:hypothetical protein
MPPDSTDSHSEDRAVDVPLKYRTLGAFEIGGSTDRTEALNLLGEHFGIRRLLLEGGGHIKGAFLQSGLANEVSFYSCPASTAVKRFGPYSTVSTPHAKPPSVSSSSPKSGAKQTRSGFGTKLFGREGLRDEIGLAKLLVPILY